MASAAAELHHAVSGDHAVTGLLGCAAAVAIWCMWMKGTWFASAFDPDDGLYRLVTLVQLAAVLVLAAGIPGLFAAGTSALIVLGYVVMRMARMAQ